MDLCGSVFTNKYAVGYPGRRYYTGCEHMDSIEQFAIDQVKEIYGYMEEFICDVDLHYDRKAQSFQAVYD